MKLDTLHFSDERDLFPGKVGKLHDRRYEGGKVELDIGSSYRWGPRKVKVWGSISYKGGIPWLGIMEI